MTVSSVNQNSFSFETVQGQHPFYPGTITFSASDSGNGQVTFSVNVNADFGGTFGLQSRFGYYLLGGSAFENNVWQNLLNNVQTACQQQ